MRVLRAIVHEQQHSGRGNALDERIERGLRLAVDPMEILEDDNERLDLALAEEHASHPVEGVLPALPRFEPFPLLVIESGVDQRQQRWH